LLLNGKAFDRRRTFAMIETFAQVSFDATIDEVVEVWLRHYASSAEFRRSRRNSMIWNGATLAILFVVVASPLWRMGFGTIVVPAVALVLGALIGFLSGFAYDHSIKRSGRRQVVEQLHGMQTLRCEVELRASGLWVRQDKVEYLYGWADVTTVEDKNISVDIITRNTIVVVRNRAFPGPADREAFIAHARRLASSAKRGDSS
jgi:hypothetical protein